MPLYEYKCASCGKKFEVIQKFADEPLTVHPDCGGAVERLISAPAFHLKGTGWYATDYAKGNGVKAVEPKSGESGSPDSKSFSTSDSKSEASDSKPDSKSEVKPSSSESKPAPSAAPDAK
jgi:putative FmdB family regulatory protein